ncbi:prephenate dehydratase [Paracoccus alcaliphilus]|nr:prephenate dehydratase [Paracoccus alcaliphilus]
MVLNIACGPRLVSSSIPAVSIRFRFPGSRYTYRWKIQKLSCSEWAVKTNRIAFQGEPGAYSHEACRKARPSMEALPCRTFEDVIEAVRSHQADLAMLPVENSTYGRVADIHHLLPESGLHIIDEAFVRVHISLLAVPGTPLSEITEAMSHTVLLGQCRGFMRRHGIHGITGADTAGSAKEVAARGNRSLAALASPLAGEIYGLDPLADRIEDRQNNTTRFLIMSREPDTSRRAERMMTTFVFRVRNIPAALYKAMGGFATNGVNMTKLESYMVDGVFTATQFYADVEGHPDDPALQRALEELRYFTSVLNILGTYPADPLRASQQAD